MSVKKKPSGRRSVQVEVEVPGSTQSAAARRSAEAELRTLIDKFAPAHLRLIGAMRRWLRKRCPPPMRWCMNIATVSSSAIHRTSTGTRAFLPSAGARTASGCTSIVVRNCRILRNCCRGPATRARWIDLEGASTLARPEVARLIDEAIARNRVPFARAGRGSVVIRSTSAKQRRRRRPA